jgi:hypothetical protein
LERLEQEEKLRRR